MFTKKIIHTLIFGIISTVFFSASIVSAYAIGISVDPLIAEINLRPGDEYEHKITLANKTEKPFRIYFEILDVEIDSRNNAVNFLPEQSKNNAQKSLASWIKPLGDKRFVLEPGQKITSPFLIDVPSTVNTGDYFSSINFYYLPPEAERGNIRVRQSVGSLSLVKIHNEEVSEETFNDYTVSPLEFTAFPQETELALSVENNTLRYIHLKPQVVIEDGAGDVFYQKQGVSKRVFPGGLYEFKETFPNAYLKSQQPMNLTYRLIDQNQGKPFFEKKLSLSEFAEKLNTTLQSSMWRYYFVYGSGVLALVFLFYWSLRLYINKKTI